MKTTIDLFENSVQKFPDNVCIWERFDGQYKGHTYLEVQQRVYAFAAGLMKLGLNPGDRVSLLSEGRLDWVVSELGIFYNGAVNVPLSVRLNEPEEIIFRLNHSESKYVIVSNRQLDKVLEVTDQLTTIEYIITIEASENTSPKLISFEQIIKEGEALLSFDGESFRSRFQTIKGDDFCNICYTSGTTADPKGIILSHRNYTANVEQAASLFTVPDWWNTLLILPWDHAFAHTCGIYTLLKHGASLACVEVGSTPMETLKNIPKNIKEIKPVFLLSVPALAKNFRKNIEGAIREKGKGVEKIFRQGLKVAYSYNGNGWDKGKGLRFLKWPFYRLFDAIIFKKIRANFGGRLKFFIGGGALLDIELQRFFYAIGIPMYQGYGLSEAAPVISSNSPTRHKMGSSGYLVSDLELKICDEDGNDLPIGEKGEIVVKGENVMKGYWQNEEATNETLKNGWLHTGDLGYLDKDGFLYVLGRYKSLLIADDGEKFSPEGIEEALIDHSEFIDQCMLHNNQQPYTVCLLVPNAETIRRYARKEGINLSSEEGIHTALKRLALEVNMFRTGGEYEDMFPQRWLPVSVALLSEAFSEDNRMINSTMKMVRPRITEHYESLLNELYKPDAKNIINQDNISALKKLLKV